MARNVKKTVDNVAKVNNAITLTDVVKMDVFQECLEIHVQKVKIACSSFDL